MAGCKIAPAEFNATIYRNIGSDYYAIIIALNLGPTPVPFHELHGQLVAHEIFLNSRHETPIANTMMQQTNTASLLPTPPTQSP